MATGATQAFDPAGELTSATEPSGAKVAYTYGPSGDCPGATTATPSGTTTNGPGDLVVVVPVTSTDYGLRSHVEIAAGVSGLKHPSYARCDHIRVVSTARIRHRRGHVTPDELRTIERALRFILDL